MHSDAWWATIVLAWILVSGLVFYRMGYRHGHEDGRMGALREFADRETENLRRLYRSLSENLD